jgi:hypothetical protein
MQLEEGEKTKKKSIGKRNATKIRRIVCKSISIMDHQ